MGRRVTAVSAVQDEGRTHFSSISATTRLLGAGGDTSRHVYIQRGLSVFADGRHAAENRVENATLYTRDAETRSVGRTATVPGVLCAALLLYANI